VALTRARKKVYIVGNKGVADPRLFNYFKLYSTTKLYNSIIKPNHKEHISKEIMRMIEQKIGILKKKTSRKRKNIGLSSEEKHLLDNIRRFKHR
jgi:superfamily I DNA and/or RNA helicase